MTQTLISHDFKFFKRFHWTLELIIFPSSPFPIILQQLEIITSAFPFHLAFKEVMQSTVFVGSF